MNKLIEETNKWQKKLEKTKDDLEKNKEEGKEFIENIEAYYDDSFYFLDKEDYVRAFECIIWAWAWYEIGTDYGFIEEK